MIPEAPLWKHGASQPYLKTAALVERKWHLPNVHEVPNHVHAIVWEQWSWGLSQCLIDRKVFFFHSSEDSVLPFCMLLISESSSLSQLGHPKLRYTGCKQPSDFRGPKEMNIKKRFLKQKHFLFILYVHCRIVRHYLLYSAWGTILTYISVISKTRKWKMMKYSLGLKISTWDNKCLFSFTFHWPEQVICPCLLNRMKIYNSSIEKVAW